MKKYYLLFLVGLSLGLSTHLFTGKESSSSAHLSHLEYFLGLNFDKDKRELMFEGVKRNKDNYNHLRELEIKTGVTPSLLFNPLPRSYTLQNAKLKNSAQSYWEYPKNVTVPEDLEELAFYSVAKLGVLLRERRITSEQLTQIFLERIKKYDTQLKSVITLTKDLALKQAQKADQEMDKGHYRGPLHGIPYGSKDLLALKGYPTTWGAKPYKDQVINQTATVLTRLSEAGAVHLAKLSLGALAWGDVWFGGKTRTPWNLEKGSSGSSAGPGSATAAGLVAFAIGTETYGSLISPAQKNGVSTLRPSYGRISRYGAMPLSWSMDKIGPMTRTAFDAALVFDSIYGPDEKDPSVYDLPFSFNSKKPLKGLRIGYEKAIFKSDYPQQKFDRKTIELLKNQGAELIEIELPRPDHLNALGIILNAEAATVFDKLTRSGKDDLMIRQVEDAWPNVLRTSRFIPAVEYLQANRARSLLIQQVDKAISDVDIFLTPALDYPSIFIGNLTGHPSVFVLNGFDDDGMPVGITFNGHLFDEGRILAVAHAYQKLTSFHKKRPL